MEKTTKFQIQYEDAGRWYTETATFSTRERAEQAAAEWRRSDPDREIRVVEKKK